MEVSCAFEGHDIGVAATRFHRAMRQNVTAALAMFDLTGAEYGALHFIAAHNEPSNSDLARYLIITPQALGRVTAGLEGRGLITRIQTSLARRYSICLTEEGVRMLDAARPSVEGAQQKLLSPLGDHERAQFMYALTACADRYDAK